MPHTRIDRGRVPSRRTDNLILMNGHETRLVEAGTTGGRSGQTSGTVVSRPAERENEKIDTQTRWYAEIGSSLGSNPRRSTLVVDPTNANLHSNEWCIAI